MMRRLPWIVGLIVVLLTVGWWVILVSPRNAEIDRLEQELATATDLEQRLRGQVRQLEEVRDREAQYLAALGQLEGLIPERPLLAEFVEEIHALSLQTGIRLDSMAPALPAISPDDDDLRQIVITTRIDGEFFQVLGFLFGLHDMERLARVDAIAVTSEQDDLDRTVLTVGLQLRLFTLADILPEDLDVFPPIDEIDGEAADESGEE